jgi:hypothetical protein
MFKPKDTQTTIFQTHLYLPDKLNKKLKESWAEIFRKDIIPAIPEEEFSELYSENMGRPCIPVCTTLNSEEAQLFVRTVEKFLKSLDPSYIEDLPEDLRKRYLEREGYFADAAPNEAQRSLIQTAEDSLFLLTNFSADNSVTSLARDLYTS